MFNLQEEYKLGVVENAYFLTAPSLFCPNS